MFGEGYSWDQGIGQVKDMKETADKNMPREKVEETIKIISHEMSSTERPFARRVMFFCDQKTNQLTDEVMPEEGSFTGKEITDIEETAMFRLKEIIDQWPFRKFVFQNLDKEQELKIKDWSTECEKQINKWIQGSFPDEKSREYLLALAIILNLSETEVIGCNNQSSGENRIEKKECLFDVLHMQQIYDVRNYADWAFLYCSRKAKSQVERWEIYCRLLSEDITGDTERKIEEKFKKFEDCLKKCEKSRKPEVEYTIPSYVEVTDTDSEDESDKKDTITSFIIGRPLLVLSKLFEKSCVGEKNATIQKKNFKKLLSTYFSKTYECVEKLDEENPDIDDIDMVCDFMYKQ